MCWHRIRIFVGLLACFFECLHNTINAVPSHSDRLHETPSRGRTALFRAKAAEYANDAPHLRISFHSSFRLQTDLMQIERIIWCNRHRPTRFPVAAPLSQARGQNMGSSSQHKDIDMTQQLTVFAASATRIHLHTKQTLGLPTDLTPGKIPALLRPPA